MLQTRPARERGNRMGLCPPGQAWGGLRRPAADRSRDGNPRGSWWRMAAEVGYNRRRDGVGERETAFCGRGQFDRQMSELENPNRTEPAPAVRPRRRTVGVRVGRVLVGGGAPIVVQSMTNTDTADAEATARQCIELAQAGSEMVRVTVNVPEAAAAVPEIKRRMLDAGCTAPLIGDFHYNGHVLLTKYPECARALDKYRINPGNVGKGARRDEQF